MTTQNGSDLPLDANVPTTASSAGVSVAAFTTRSQLQSERSFDGSLSNLERLSIILLVVALYSGAFSFGRIGAEIDGLGILNQARIWLFVPLFALVTMWSCTSLARPPQSRLLTTWSGLFVALMSYLAISTTWAPEPGLALERILDLALLGGTVVVAPMLFATQTRAKCEFLLQLIVGISVLFALGGLSNFDQWRETGRLSAFSGGPNVFGRIVGTGALLVLYLFQTRGKRWVLLFFPLLAGCLVFSGSRSAVVAFIAAAGVLITGIVIAHPGSGRKLLAGLFLIVVATALIPNVATAAYQRWIVATFANNNTGGRLTYFSEAWEFFKQAPLLGVGLDGYRSLTAYIEPYPHNLFLHIAAEGGAVALALLLSLLLLPLFRIANSNNGQQLALLALATLNFVFAMFAGGIYDGRFLWLYVSLFLVLSESVQE